MSAAKISQLSYVGYRNSRNLLDRLLHTITTLILITATVGLSIWPVKNAYCVDKRSVPNIVIILVDDLGWTDVGCFGSKYYETPNIDRLAARGMRFTNGYAACAVCSPTRASIMTGKYPARLHITNWIPGEGDAPWHLLRVPNWQPFLPLEEITVASALKPAGYVSAAIGKWHLGNEP